MSHFKHPRWERFVVVLGLKEGWWEVMSLGIYEQSGDFVDNAE